MSSWIPVSFRIYRRLASWIVPGNRHTQRLYHDMLCGLLKPGLDWLDLGCGHQILPPWVNADEPGMVASCRKAVGIDLDFPSLRANKVIRDRVMGTLESLPFPTGSFDLVTANMVVEHLSNPEVALAEIRRVLRPGGRFLFHTPNRLAPVIRIAAHTPEWIKLRLIWLLERRKPEDVFPTHYECNTVADVTTHARRAGFAVEELVEVNSTATTAILGPFALPELLYMRALEWEKLRGLRTNLLVILRKE